MLGLRSDHEEGVIEPGGAAGLLIGEAVDDVAEVGWRSEGVQVDGEGVRAGVEVDGVAADDAVLAVEEGQIEAVIADKCKEWFADKRNHKYMRLDTILAYSNFEKYLNDIKAGMPSDSSVVKMPNKPENLALEKEIIQMGYKCPPEELKALQSDFFKRYSSFDQAKRNEMIIRLLASDQAKQHGTIKKVLANLSRIISQLVNSRKNDDAKK